jgi:hypothetical protein
MQTAFIKWCFGGKKFRGRHHSNRKTPILEKRNPMAESSLQKSTEKEVATPTSQHKAVMLAKWQERMVPFMLRMVVGLTLFFFVASCVQLAYLHLSIKQAPKLDMRESFSLLSVNSEPTFQEMLAVSKLKAITRLEANALERRYHQANVLLMSRVWTRYLGFVTGMILALVGATFILGKLQEPASELAAKVQVSEFSFKSASPGVILAGLGVILMFMTIITHHEIGVTDRPVYIQEYHILPATSEESLAPPPLEHPGLPKPKGE